MSKLKVIKRDGLIKDFDEGRIISAVKKAYEEAELEVNIDILGDILKKVQEVGKDKERLSVEEIQDVVVDILKKEENIVGELYEKYRLERNFEREKNSELVKEIDKIIDQKSEENTSNANVDGSKLQSWRALVSNYVLGKYSMYKYIPKKYRKKHKKELYIHDLPYFGLGIYNCNVINWQNMFKYGFKIGSTQIESPKSLTSAINILSQVASHIASNTYGGCTFGNLTTGLTSYAKLSLEKHRKMAEACVMPEKREWYIKTMFEKECEDVAQSLEYEVQTLMTSRGETPFLTIGLDPVDEFADEETRYIQENIVKAILNQRIKGLTGGVTPVFPKIVYHLRNGNNLNSGDPYYHLFKLAVKCSAFRGYPDYLNEERLKEVSGTVIVPMGCRSFPSLFVDKNGNEVTSGRFNWGVLSINLVRLAIKAKGDEVKFFKQLDEVLNDCKELFKIKYNILKNIRAEQAPILYMSGAIARLNAKDTIEPLLNNNYSSVSIGYVGLQNCLKSLYGEGLENQNPKIIKKGEAIMQHIRDFCDKQKKETGIGYSMYGTPKSVGV